MRSPFPKPHCARQYGFSLIELMIAVTIFGLLTAVGIPSFVKTIQDSKTRTIAESIQNALRLTRTEAVKRGLQVQFFLTADTNPTLNSPQSTAGPNWGIVAMDLLTGTVPTTFVQGGNLSGNAGSVVVAASNSVVRFNSIGRVTTPTKPVTLTVTNAKGARRYNVVVSINGSVRMCDPDKTRSSTAPDGC